MTSRYTYPEAAAALHCPESWLRKKISQLPHRKRGKTVVFTDSDLDEIDRMTAVSPRARNTCPDDMSVIPLHELKPRTRTA